ncbi:MAG: hypothetical protein ABIN97_05185 [Ginsengibacter sp.]
MDTKSLIANLHSVFCEFNREKKKYSEIWLTEADFGGLYNSGKYVLNLKAEHDYYIDSCGHEIEEILTLLDQKAKEELQFIWSVDIYDSDEEIHCQSMDTLVYEDQKACT